jgi:hypothetical protein
MRLKFFATAIAICAGLALLAAPADAAVKKKKTLVTTAAGHTVFVNRDEDGRTRTKIIIQKRSYLDPGTETFPGENTGYTNYVQSPTHRATSVLDNTTAGTSQSPLPGPFTLTGKNNSWIQF